MKRNKGTDRHFAQIEKWTDLQATTVKHTHTLVTDHSFENTTRATVIMKGKLKFCVLTLQTCTSIMLHETSRVGSLVLRFVIVCLVNYLLYVLFYSCLVVQ